MSKFNSIMQLLVALFFAVSLVFFLSFESTKSLFGMETLQSGTVVTFLLVGLILFLCAWGTSSLVARNLRSDLAKKELEKKELKARMYDLEQSIKLKSFEQRIEPKEEEKDNSVIKPRQNFK
ncbi:hypothetical protein ACFOUP_02110 [Belliella kenyensis]|uniref:Lipopolysaccharide assembly protein A domain-containing protein n=1 Tax=Belliella kenyensis TaxID=1472724 RepID=A0ABV8EHQ7_9BACT|nr:hypothetical protein [Belliella kenyensis]MCH7401010.1 hypothetical protein [Belliella kenyensis]MDN3604008.1 hypothetical protein [Belliella kenyensis]